MGLFVSEGPEDTLKIGEKLAGEVRPGTVIALTGDLGAGKTLFTKGFAKGLGVREEVDSPTFNILKSYDSGRIPLYHFDVYRIGDVSEMEETGYEDCFYGEGVSLIEWAEIIEELLPEETVRVRIERDPDKGPDHREITIDDNTVG